MAQPDSVWTYRRLYPLTRKDAYPLPRVDDTLATLSGSKWFTALDLISDNWQVETHPEHREDCILYNTGTVQV